MLDVMRLWMVLCAVLVAASGCEPPPPQGDYVARLDDDLLTADDLAASLELLSPNQDSTAATSHIAEQWVVNQLLVDEAQRLNLGALPDVQRQIEQNAQSILIAALVDEWMADAADAASDDELATYYARNRNLLVLREPYVRVRYAVLSDRAEAEACRQDLQDATRRAIADSLWVRRLADCAEDPDEARALATQHIPERQLMQTYPVLGSILPRLGDGELAPLLEQGDKLHLVQVAERHPVGTVPELAWVEDEIRNRIAIQRRKQIYSRQVQRLRTEALAQERLDIRY
ncbi:MAG: peptidylprolyl isomerase [Bacteroidota bacterium]